MKIGVLHAWLSPFYELVLVLCTYAWTLWFDLVDQNSFEGSV